MEEPHETNDLDEHPAMPIAPPMPNLYWVKDRGRRREILGPIPVWRAESRRPKVSSPTSMREAHLDLEGAMPEQVLANTSGLAEITVVSLHADSPKSIASLRGEAAALTGSLQLATDSDSPAGSSQLATDSLTGSLQLDANLPAARCSFAHQFLTACCRFSHWHLTARHRFVH